VGHQCQISNGVISVAVSHAAIHKFPDQGQQPGIIGLVVAAAHHLDQTGHDMEEETALRRAGVDSIGEALELNTLIV